MCTWALCFLHPIPLYTYLDDTGITYGERSFVAERINQNLEMCRKKGRLIKILQVTRAITMIVIISESKEFKQCYKFSCSLQKSKLLNISGIQCPPVGGEQNCVVISCLYKGNLKIREWSLPLTNHRSLSDR